MVRQRQLIKNGFDSDPLTMSYPPLANTIQTCRGQLQDGRFQETLREEDRPPYQVKQGPESSVYIHARTENIRIGFTDSSCSELRCFPGSSSHGWQLKPVLVYNAAHQATR